MTSLHVTIAWLCLTTVACGEKLTGSGESAEMSHDWSPSTAVRGEWPPLSPYPQTGPPPRLDRYGNPVEHAVGDYRVDPFGDTYESHAPQVELSALPPAGT